MGTESACGSYYNEQQAGTGPAMTNYYQMNDSGGGGRSEGTGGNNASNENLHGSNNHPDDEVAQGVGNSNSDDPGESELDLRHQDQQRSAHNDPPRNPSVNVSNPWSISQQIQNHISNNPASSHPSRLERSNSLASNWTFPSYQRLYNENHYGIAIAAAVQHQLPGTSQPQSHQSHHPNNPSQHHQPSTHQQNQQNQQHSANHHQQLQQQQQQQQHPHSGLLMPAGINGSGGMPQNHQHLSKRFYYPSTTAKPTDLNARTRRGGTELSPPPGSQHYVQILQTRPPKQPQFCEAKRLGACASSPRRAYRTHHRSATQSRSHRQSCKNLDQTSQPSSHTHISSLGP
ncbi:hypothetical protein RP20_CCG016712 [Aedes albopictus]|nr:hypothetical protein RP20_CCG016712 [Aedes albopictus]